MAGPLKTERLSGPVGGPDMSVVNRSFDVPYLAGSSNKGFVTYIDRRVPRSITVTGGKKIDPAYPLAVHEQTEHRLMNKGMGYYPAHRRAERAELEWFLLRGFSRADFESYDHQMTVVATHVTEKEQVQRPPPDLYLKPYSFRRQEAIRMKERGMHNA